MNNPIYFERLTDAIESINYVQVLALADLIRITAKNDGVVWIAGNGGSAATANHMAVDLSFGIRPLGSVRAISLSDSAESITATGNDVSFGEVFSRRVQSLAKANDLLILISASGNSPNLLNAASAASQMGVKTAGVLGFDGGALASDVDLLVLTPCGIGDYGIAEDLHLAVNHCLKELLNNGE